MSLTFEEMKEKILERYDPDDILDILGLSSEQLVDRFPDLVVEYWGKFELDNEEVPDEWD